MRGQNPSPAPAPASPAVALLPGPEAANTGPQGSSYIPVDYWIYPAMERLQALGYVDTAYLGLRPWTRLSILHMLERTEPRIEANINDDEARRIFLALAREFQPEVERSSGMPQPRVKLESVYSLFRGIGGTPLRDSYHLGQSIVDDYGRPYESGFNDYSGFSARASVGRLSLYWRGEFQHAPSAVGYSPALAAFLSNTLDEVPYATNPNQDTIPAGLIPTASDMRVVEANLSFHLIGHEISFGKTDQWLGPAKGASMLWGDNAENIYQFQINRIEPLYVPGLSKLTGPFRYVFFVGSLKGHTAPNSPYVHMEKISFKPTRNLEFGFDRMAIWGGEGHEPVTLHTFLQSFFSFQNVPVSVKDSAKDPGYRLGTFDFTYRLPFLRRWVTIYTDSLVHDDVSPVSAPLRSGYRPGIYLARFPRFENLSLRVEGATTDTVSSSLQNGQFLYWEGIQKQGPTNKGFLVGDWIGREGKGGQAWLTYHLSPREEVGIEYRRAKAATGFIPGGTTQNDIAVEVHKWVRNQLEIRGRFNYEAWKAPIYMPGRQSDTTAAVQLTWYPF